MIETKDISNMVKHILRRDKGIADTHIMHPTREWFIGVGMALMIVSAGSLFCFYLYTVFSGKIQEENIIIESAVPYQAITVKSALELFSAKQKKFSEIVEKNNVGGQAEPSAISTSVTTTTTTTTTPNIPELIIDPPPIFEDNGTPIEATLAP